ncbi:MAG: deoxyuridine 5'-triphosphate nucleotidohydrolase [Clostridia bacterium]|nr:deoxyuridine 5'-triphosphate nucleotidohydrolase [Clostridia bacterium]
MNSIAAFEKVGYNVFLDWCKKEGMGSENAKAVYDSIKLPRRATVGSAGYDFFSPFNITVEAGGSVVIPTGIRCHMDEGWVLMLFPRSGLGFKTGMHLANTVGIIDADYYYSDNEGHILVKIVNDSSLAANLTLQSGGAFCQGIFLPFGIAEGDDTSEIRNGGFGSSGR